MTLYHLGYWFMGRRHKSKSGANQQKHLKNISQNGAEPHSQTLNKEVAPPQNILASDGGPCPMRTLARTLG